MTSKVSKRRWEKAWQTVGRFLRGFATVESYINEIFVQLYNLDQSAFIALVMIGRLSFQEKLELIGLGLKYADRKERQEGEHNIGVHKGWKKLQNEVHDLQNIRKMIDPSDDCCANAQQSLEAINGTKLAVDM